MRFPLLPLLLRQMQDLADDYQRALADISSLRAIYDTEIEGLTEELSQCKATHGEEPVGVGSDGVAWLMDENGWYMLLQFSYFMIGN